jgi:spore coat protein U-like protein
MTRAHGRIARWLVAALAAIAALAPAPAAAGTCGQGGTSAMTLSATPVAFGTYNATVGSPTDASGTITLTCADGADDLPSLTVSLSTGIAGTFAPRHMVMGGDNLIYNLYTSAAYATVWGDGTGGTATQSHTTGGNTTSFTVYGRVPAAQYVAPGAYSDTITVTVTY